MKENKVKVITDLGVLMRLARDMAKARKEGDPEKIKKAKKKHDDYHAICLKSDEMMIGINLREIL